MFFLLLNVPNSPLRIRFSTPESSFNHGLRDRLYAHPSQRTGHASKGIAGMDGEV